MKLKNKVLSLFIIILFILTGCNNTIENESSFSVGNCEVIDGLSFSYTVANTYAEQFRIDRYEGGYSLIETMYGDKFLIVPENGKIPENLDSSIDVIQQPLKNVYLAASSAMGLFAEMDSCDTIAFSGTKKEDWCIEKAVEAMENGSIVYAGKYREPDYELLLSNGCTLSIQSSMIDKVPDVKSKLKELGIPVFVDYSSYESHPLGRSEWVKVYGEMCGKSGLAEEIFNKQAAELNKVESSESTGKTVVFFYISSGGQVNTRKSGDYISKMIELAGGVNIFSNIGDPEKDTSTITMEMEEFYSTAKEADFIIYNATIDGQILTIDELVAKNSLLADFKAVKEGNVWCTPDNFYQETLKLGTVISDFHAIFSNTTDTNPPKFLYKLESGE